MRFAPVLGKHMQTSLEHSGFKYQMAIASQMLVDAGYQEKVRQMCLDGHYVILDNGVWETGQSISDSKLISLAMQVGASEIVIPDSMKDPESSLLQAESFLKLFYSQDMAAYERPKLMLVPQAKVADAWHGQYLLALKTFGPYVDTIGIPKWLGPARLSVINEMPFYAKFDYHMLGCNGINEIPRDVSHESHIHSKMRSQIRSIDSSLPHVLAYRVIAIESFDPNFSQYIVRQPNYFSMNLDIVQTRLLNHNLRQLTDLTLGHYYL